MTSYKSAPITSWQQIRYSDSSNIHALQVFPHGDDQISVAVTVCGARSDFLNSQSEFCPVDSPLPISACTPLELSDCVSI
jgi:hypothetical protein